MARARAASERTSPEPEAAPRKKKKRVSQQDVVDAAMRLFAERGYDGLSMADLAKSVGLQKASLFHHFPTKEAVYGRVLEILVDELGRAVGAAAAAKGRFAERLDALTEALTESLGKHPHAARLLVREAMHAGPGVGPSVGGKIDAILAAGRALVVEGQRTGACDRDLDPTHAVITILGIYFMPFALGGVIHRFAGMDPDHPAFLSARTVAVREHVRRVLAVRADV